MEKPKVLYVSQEVTPFLPESNLSKICRNLPQGISENGKEIRVFTPRFGKINERRHQLHEVIRLSGMNLIINDSDHPLIIKVASIPTARMQVYFIDSEEYFHRKAVVKDKDGNFFEDNDERAIFFCKGVIETVKKLGWAPDIIHCHGWMSAFMPLYVKRLYADDPHFAHSKIVYSVYGNGGPEALDTRLSKKLEMEGFTKSDLPHLDKPTYDDLNKLAIDFSDGVIQGEETVTKDVQEYLGGLEQPVLEPQPEEDYIGNYNAFYDKVLDETKVLAG